MFIIAKTKYIEKTLKLRFVSVLSIGILLSFADLSAKESKAEKKSTSSNSAASKRKVGAKKEIDASKKTESLPRIAAVSKNSDHDKNINNLSGQYSKNEINERDLLEALSRVDSTKLSDSGERKSDMLRWLAFVKVGLSVAAATEAFDKLSKATDPMSDDFERYWILLKTISATDNIQYLFNSYFSVTGEKFKAAPKKFGNDYYYYLANYYQENNKEEEAQKYYEKLTLGDRDYLRAKYQLGLLHYKKNRLDDAILQLKIVLNNTALEVNTGLSSNDRKQLLNYAKMAVARIFYEKKEFKNAINFYRSVDRDSNQFYQALFEQSWAFFLAGYPNHALGSLYSVNSPFFDHKFNPEAGILSSLVYYWLCRYDDASFALEKFKKRYGDKIAGLESFLNRKRLNAKQGYELFENYLSGVSAETLKMDPSVLATASQDDSLWSLKFQMAAILNTEEKIKQLNILPESQEAKLSKLLRSHIPTLRESIGSAMIVSLEKLKKQYELINSQAQFLNIELLMSKKEKVLGRELHASSKIDKVSKRQLVDGWSTDVNSWAVDNRGEYWWDEIGFHIYDLQPQCKSSH